MVDGSCQACGCLLRFHMPEADGRLFCKLCSKTCPFPSSVHEIAKARAKKALALFRDGVAVKDSLFAPAPRGLSVEDVDALVSQGFACRAYTMGKQQLIRLTPMGIEARDKPERYF